MSLSHPDIEIFVSLPGQLGHANRDQRSFAPTSEAAQIPNDSTGLNVNLNIPDARGTSRLRHSEGAVEKHNSE